MNTNVTLWSVMLGENFMQFNVLADTIEQVTEWVTEENADVIEEHPISFIEKVADNIHDIRQKGVS